MEYRRISINKLLSYIRIPPRYSDGLTLIFLDLTAVLRKIRLSFRLGSFLRRIETPPFTMYYSGKGGKSQLNITADK